MNPSLSFIKTVLDRMRALVDEPDVDAKYTDDFLLRHCVMPAMVDVYSRLNQNSDCPIVIRYALSITNTQHYYQLPPCIQEIWRLVTTDDMDNITGDWYPRGQMHPSGPGWSIEGNLLTVDPKLTEGLDIHIFYVPNGDFLPHYSTSAPIDQVTYVGDPSPTMRVRLNNTPPVGQLDRRENSYAGAILRALSGSRRNVVEERIVTRSYVDPDFDNWYCDLRVPFTQHASGDTITYELAPAGSQPLYQAIATEAACTLGTFRKIGQDQMKNIILMHRVAMKTIKDNMANLQLRTGKAYLKNTIDNPQFMQLF